MANQATKKLQVMLKLDALLANATAITATTPLQTQALARFHANLPKVLDAVKHDAAPSGTLKLLNKTLADAQLLLTGIKNGQVVVVWVKS